MQETNQEWNGHWNGTTEQNITPILSESNVSDLIDAVHTSAWSFNCAQFPFESWMSSSLVVSGCVHKCSDQTPFLLWRWFDTCPLVLVECSTTGGETPPVPKTINTHWCLLCGICIFNSLARFLPCTNVLKEKKCVYYSFYERRWASIHSHNIRYTLSGLKCRITIIMCVNAKYSPPFQWWWSRLHPRA